MQKRLMISATRENDGKTFITVGLTTALKKKFPKIGFIKPLGMKDVVSGEVGLDEDVILVEKACSIHSNIQDMNPVQLSHSELEEFWKEGRKENLVTEIMNSYDSVCEGKDMVVIEGAGHAGAGSAFGLSTAWLAQKMKARVILVTSGGISHPLDEITLNLSHFLKYDVDVIGVILNKVKLEHIEEVESLLPEMLEKRNVELLGAIPRDDLFTKPSMMQVLESLRGRLLHGEQYLGRTVSRTFIGAMRPWRVLNHFENDGLIITPGDREDLLLTMLSLRSLGKEGGRSVAGIVLTGGIMPHQNVLKLLKRTDIPLILTPEYSYDVAQKIQKIQPKIRPSEKEKINRITELTQKYVKLDRIVEKI